MKDQIISSLLIIAALVGWTWYQRDDMLHQLQQHLETQKKEIQLKNAQDTMEIVNHLRDDLARYKETTGRIEQELEDDLNKKDCSHTTKNNLSECLRLMREAAVKHRAATSDFIQTGKENTK